MRRNDDLIDEVESRAVHYLGGRPRSGRVVDAMRRVDRALFLPENSRREAYEDGPVPIGRGQTCSEPSMVAFMLDILETAPGQRILEIGAGSGYAAAVASLLCGPNGIVYACETIELLAESMREHFARWSDALRGAGPDSQAARIEIIVGDGSAGFPELAPFDRILISAGVRQAQPGRGFSELALLRQLVDEGILVYPESFGELHRTRKTKDGATRDAWTGVSFVPLVGRNA